MWKTATLGDKSKVYYAAEASSGKAPWESIPNERRELDLAAGWCVPFCLISSVTSSSTTALVPVQEHVLRSAFPTYSANPLSTQHPCRYQYIFYKVFNGKMKSIASQMVIAFEWRPRRTPRSRRSSHPQLHTRHPYTIPSFLH